MPGPTWAAAAALAQLLALAAPAPTKPPACHRDDRFDAQHTVALDGIEMRAAGEGVVITSTTGERWSLDCTTSRANTQTNQTCTLLPSGTSTAAQIKLTAIGDAAAQSGSLAYVTDPIHLWSVESNSEGDFIVRTSSGALAATGTLKHPRCLELSPELPPGERRRLIPLLLALSSPTDARAPADTKTLPTGKPRHAPIFGPRDYGRYFSFDLGLLVAAGAWQTRPLGATAGTPFHGQVGLRMGLGWASVLELWVDIRFRALGPPAEGWAKTAGVVLEDSDATLVGALGLSLVPYRADTVELYLNAGINFDEKARYAFRASDSSDAPTAKLKMIAGGWTGALGLRWSPYSGVFMPMLFVEAGMTHLRFDDELTSEGTHYPGRDALAQKLAAALPSGPAETSLELTAGIILRMELFGFYGRKK